MHSPGITVRPLVQMTGESGFNEVFFEDVRVPKKNLVGEKNQGWQVAITTLMFERSRRRRRRDMLDAGAGARASWRKTIPRNGSTAWEDTRPCASRSRVRMRGRSAQVHRLSPD